MRGVEEHVAQVGLGTRRIAAVDGVALHDEVHVGIGPVVHAQHEATVAAHDAGLDGLLVIGQVPVAEPHVEVLGDAHVELDARDVGLGHVVVLELGVVEDLDARVGRRVDLDGLGGLVGVAQGVSEDILEDLRANFQGECSEVGMYLAMARVAHREGYPEIGLYYEKAAYEEAEHAAKFAELLGEVVTDSTKKNLEMRVEAENGATAGKFDLAKRAKAADLDAIHDTVHEMAKDEARHGKAFAGLLKRYFG